MTRTHVLVNDRAGVLGFFTLTMHSIRADEFPARAVRGISGAIPAVLLGKMAKSDSHALPRDLLLATASLTALRASMIAASRVIVLDADHPRLIDYYASSGFDALPTQPPGQRVRMFKPIKDVAADAGWDWPL